MSNLLVFEVAAPLLALLSLMAIAWVRRQNRRMRRQALNMQRRLEIDLNGLQDKGQSIRQRTVLVADAICRGEADGRDTLTRGIDKLLADVERLRWDLRIVASRWGHSRRGDIRETYARIEAMVTECQELGRDLDERDGLWREQLSNMPSLSKAAHEMTGTRKQVLTEREQRHRNNAVQSDTIRDLIVDLSTTEFMDCRSLSVPVAALKRTGTPQSLAVVGAHGSVARILALTGMDRVFALHATTGAALAQMSTQ